MSRVAVRNEQIPFRLPVDRVFSKDGFGTVVTGTAFSGMVKAGDPLYQLDDAAYRAQANSARAASP